MNRAADAISRQGYIGLPHIKWIQKYKRPVSEVDAIKPSWWWHWMWQILCRYEGTPSFMCKGTPPTCYCWKLTHVKALNTFSRHKIKVNWGAWWSLEGKTWTVKRPPRGRQERYIEQQISVNENLHDLVLDNAHWKQDGVITDAISNRVALWG